MKRSLCLGKSVSNSIPWIGHCWQRSIVAVSWKAAIAILMASTLSAGASKADTSGTCYFDNLGDPLPGVSCTGYSIQLGDKLFTVKTAPTLSAGKVAWETSPALPATPILWQVNIDWINAGLPGPATGLFEYTAEINQGDFIFNSIGLSTGGNYVSGLPNSTVTASVFQGLTGAGPLIDSVTSIDGTANYSNLISGTQIFVRDSWNIQSGDTIDNLSNYITQANPSTSVPAPVPFAAIPVVLAWGRRLRRRIRRSSVVIGSRELATDCSA